MKKILLKRASKFTVTGDSNYSKQLRTERLNKIDNSQN